ncbi:MAG: alkaline phosphatase family protein [Acidobacteriota bacterium]|nr:alkaline phosphatase family protein [Blastocatellia bacterium]MDW8412687.1 alkaline phosphatase family protein [Acidobacteriota bacterium]
MKAIVIGLDGATLEVIKQLIEQDKMPVFAKLMQEGAHGLLRSSITPNSFPGWTSASTGTSEGRHGIFTPLVRREDNFLLKAMNSSDIRTKTLWELLSERGRRVCVINDPCSYPPIAVNGLLVCGMLWPGGDAKYTYPESLALELARMGYIVDVNLNGKGNEQIAAELMHSIDRRLEAVLKLSQQDDWDLVWAVFTESDRAQHRLWAAWDDKHPNHSAQPSTLRNAIPEIYSKLDAAVGAIISIADKDTAVFIVSDHGFGPFYASFDVHAWLLAEGYLVEKGHKAKLKSLLRKAGILEEAIAAYRKLRRPFENRIEYGTKKLNSQAAFTETYLNQVDWQRTVAYYTLDGGIRLNLRGREPHGWIEEHRAAELKEEIRAKLLAQRYPNGTAIFRYVLTQEEAYDGPYSRYAPDLILSADHAGYNGPLKGNPFLRPCNHNSGEHTPYGILFAYGAKIRCNTVVEGAKLIDIAPTVLYYLDEPLTMEMDGRVLTELFTPEFNRSRQIKRTGSSYRNASEASTATTFEDDSVAEKLRSLGYI